MASSTLRLALLDAGQVENMAALLAEIQAPTQRIGVAEALALFVLSGPARLVNSHQPTLAMFNKE
jgi:hypothetical protein